MTRHLNTLSGVAKDNLSPLNSLTGRIFVKQSGQKLQSVLIAGCGYLGRQAAHRWLANGVTVYAMTRSPETAASFSDDGIVPIQCDLSSPPATIELPSVDIVLWAVGYDRSAGVAREAVWIDGLTWLLKNLKPTLKRFLYVSSTSVYGQADQEIVTEDCPPSPITDGGLCCQKAEQIVRDHFAASDEVDEARVSATVLRMAGIYGPDRLLRRITDLKQQVPLVGEPDHWLNLIHVDDAVSAVHYAASQSNFPSVVNVANTGTVVRQNYYQQLADLANAPPPTFGSQAATGRARSANKRVTSKHDFHQAAGFRFDVISDGLDDAFQRSSLVR